MLLNFEPILFKIFYQQPYTKQTDVKSEAIFSYL